MILIMISPLPGMAERVALAPLTTIGIGGPARYFFEAGSVDDLRLALQWASRHGLPAFVLGGGSNVLISDEGFDGLVIRTAIRGVVHAKHGGSVAVTAGAGESWDALVQLAVERNWSGIEALSGIPGSVGATPIQNVGAYGQEVAETILQVEALHRATGTMRAFTPEDCRFAYRHSIFKGEAKDEFVVTSVRFRLEPAGAPALRYPELQRTVAERFGDAPGLNQVREAVLDIRRKKGMVLDPSDPDTRSDGSFFMNPIVAAEELQAFMARATAIEPSLRADEIPVFPMPDGRAKLSAAWLIERAGFRRGWGAGKAGLSSKHTLAIVNRGGATARDVLGVVAEIQKTVANRFGVALRPEPNFIGF